MISGDEITGNISEISSEVLTLTFSTIKGKQKREILFSEIVKLEIKEDDDKMSTVGVVVVVVLTAALIASLAALSAMDDTLVTKATRRRLK